MKRFVAVVLTLIFFAVTFVLVSCTTENAVLLSTPVKAETLSVADRYSQQTSEILAAANAFAVKFSDKVYTQLGRKGNFTVAPVSVYMAMSLAAECAAGSTRTELLNALGVTDSQLENGFSTLYRSLLSENKDSLGKVASCLELSNSVWTDDGASVKQSCADKLAQNYFCYPYMTDFDGDNDGANEAIRRFVKERTHGLIDKNFQLSESTLIALMNVLYLKDIWNDGGIDLDFDDVTYDFVNGDGSIAGSTSFMRGNFLPGRAFDGGNYRHFYAKTQHGYKLKFIVPKQGYSVADVFTPETIAEVNALSDYGADDADSNTHYKTRCLFPEFDVGYDSDVLPVLQRDFGINGLFTPDVCDLSSLTDDDVFCNVVQHVTKLTVNRKGIEGAAVTVAGIAESATPDDWNIVEENFVVDRAFGFVLTDKSDTVIFCGVVYNL